MRPEERSGLAATVDGTVRAVVDTVEGMHQAIAGTSFRGPGAVVPKLIHDAISTGVYATVRAAGGPAASLAARLLSTDESSLSDTRGGAYALATVDAWAGDKLAAAGNPLAVPMSVRVDGRAVDASSLDLAGTVVVFLHGLGETEHAWGLHSEVRPTYAALIKELGATPLQVRYNTGAHISANGADLSALLASMTGVDRLVLVGHSMGGLIIRSACHQGGSWVPLVADTVSIGTPHHGSAVERLANLGTAVLKATRWTRPLGRLADTRSAGIKDLRYGNLVDADWQDVEDPDELWVDRATDIPLLATARHHFVAASLGRDPAGRYASLVGDLLVVPSSAHGTGRTARRTSFTVDEPHHIPGTTHFGLLNHPAVADILSAVVSHPAAGLAL